jgi:hypothetical protein
MGLLCELMGPYLPFLSLPTSRPLRLELVLDQGTKFIASSNDPG